MLLALHPMAGRPRGDGWARCLEQRAAIERWLGDGLRLTKIRKLLVRQGVEIAYPTLHRFAVLELQFGKTATTIPVLDGEPGQELQLDTGWVGRLTLPERKWRRFRAWIFTAVRSRHRFVYPTFEETTARAIEACEAAWEFFGGIFTVLIPDNTKAIVITADPLAPRITPAFLEYAQARHFHIDPARVRPPRDKGRVERAVPGVRDDCFAGEVLTTLDDARAWGRHWCLNDYGLRRHSRTQRRPLEHFQAEEQGLLRPAPTTPYDIPLWSEPKVGRDQLAAVAKALYSIPHPYVGQWVTGARRCAARPLLRARAADQDASAASPRRPVDRRERLSGRAQRLRDAQCRRAPAPGRRRRRGRSAATPPRCSTARCRGRGCGASMRCSASCAATARRASPRSAPIALAADMLDVHRLKRMLEQGIVAPPVAPPARVIPLARYLRPATQYALPLRPAAPSEGEESQ